jgi:hypothetical protein
LQAISLVNWLQALLTQTAWSDEDGSLASFELVIWTRRFEVASAWKYKNALGPLAE